MIRARTPPMRLSLALLVALPGACADPGRVAVHDADSARKGIGAVLATVDTAWRRADFAAANAPFLDEAVSTFNASRRTGAEVKAVSGPPRFSGQYISAYAPRYQVLAPGVAVTTWQNDFARIERDGTQGAMQQALMTIVWARRNGRWHIADYHESTRPKPLAPAPGKLADYVGSYAHAEGDTVRFRISGKALQLVRNGQPAADLLAFTDPDFGLKETRITFVRTRGGTVSGVLFADADGTSRFAWRTGSGIAN